MLESSATVRIIIIIMPVIKINNTLLQNLVQAYVKMVKFDSVTKKILIKEKVEWRCASMECGGQCVQMDGIKLLLILSALSLDTALEITVGYHRSIIFLFLSLSAKGISPAKYPPLFDNIVCSENYSMLLQCFDVHNFGIYDNCESGTAEVICEMSNVSSENMSHSMSTSVSIILL